jgi:hypothetical protein
MKDEVPVATQMIVDVVVMHQGVPLGEDSGVLVSIDGWLSFTGRQSEFCLGTHDVQSVTYGRKVRPWLPTTLKPEDYPVCLGLRRGQSIGLVPRRGHAVTDADFAYLQQVVERWTYMGYDEAGVTVLPPGQPHPSGYFYAWLASWQGFGPGMAAFAAFALVSVFAEESTWLGVGLALAAVMIANGRRRASQSHRILDKVAEVQVSPAPVGH